MKSAQLSSQTQKVMVIAGYAHSLVNFRGPLLQAIREKGYQVVCAAPENDDAVQRKLEEMDISYFPIPLERTGLNPWADLRGALALLKLIRLECPDLVLSYTVKPIVFGSLMAKWAGVKNIFSLVTGLGYAFTAQGFKARAVQLAVRTLYWMALRTNKATFFQNPDDLELFVSGGLVSRLQTRLVNGSGVDLEYYTKAELPTGEITFLLIARLLKEKGIFEYVEAARVLKVKYPQLRFVLVGPLDSNPSGLSVANVDQWQKEGVIEYRGFQADVRSELAQCHVYVLPSYREGTPRTVLEAMAVGRAIVTTEAPGCRETVVHGLNGFLVPVADSKALTRAMERFVLSPQLIQQMGEASLQMVRDRYDVHKVNAQMLDAMGLV